MAQVTVGSHAGGYQLAKRATDIVLCLCMLLALCLVLPFIALLVKLESPGSVLFSQERVGRNGRRFGMRKFRSMYADAEDRLHADEELYAEYCAHGFKLPENRDPRVTKVGRILRKTSLDELPQLFNVLAGSMSLVGPRPVVPREVDELYGDRAYYYLSVKPGLTGLWQISGRSHVRGEDRAELDIEYVQSASWSKDLLILLKTIPAVLTGHGAH